VIAVAIAALLAYAATIAYDFVWDDLILIRDRLHMYTAANLKRLIFSDLFSHGEWGESSFFRPLVVLSFFAELTVWGMRPAGFHLTNVVAHALVSVAVVRLAVRVGVAEIGALAAGLVFALHPVHTESVAFVSGRTDVFATMFALGALLAYARWRERGGGAALVFSLAAFALALLSKEVAVVVPLLLLLYDAVIARDGWTARVPLRYVPYAVVLVAYAGLRHAAVGVPTAGAPAVGGMVWADGATRILTTLKLAAWNAWLAVLPLPTNLSYEVRAEAWPPDASWWLAMAALLALLGATVFALRRWPSVGLGLAWWWIALIPVLGASVLPGPKPLLADRFLYLPTVGTSLAIGALAARWLGEATAGRLLPRTTSVPTAAMVALLLGYGVLTMSRNEDWRDEMRVAYRTVETSPDAVLPRLNLAINQLLLGQVAEARANLQRAVRRAPDHPVILVTLGFTETLIGDADRGLALARRASGLAPDNPLVLGYLAEVYGRRGELASAADTLEHSLRINPDQVRATMTLALVQHWLGRNDAALASVDRGVALNARTRQNDLLVDKVTAEVCRVRQPVRARAAWDRYIAGLRRLPRSGQIDAEIANAERQRGLLP
jgi:tetratricopeptide (TPR) repeat protein